MPKLSKLFDGSRSIIVQMLYKLKLSVQCNTLHGTEYKITCGVCLCVRTGIGVEYLENG